MSNPTPHIERFRTRSNRLKQNDSDLDTADMPDGSDSSTRPETASPWTNHLQHESVETLMADAQACLEADEIEKAVQEAEAARHLASQESGDLLARTLVLRGVKRQRAGNLEGALADYVRARDLAPRTSSLHSELTHVVERITRQRGQPLGLQVYVQEARTLEAAGDWQRACSLYAYLINQAKAGPQRAQWNEAKSRCQKELELAELTGQARTGLQEWHHPGQVGLPAETPRRRSGDMLPAERPNLVLEGVSQEILPERGLPGWMTGVVGMSLLTTGVLLALFLAGWSFVRSFDTGSAHPVIVPPVVIGSPTATATLVAPVQLPTPSIAPAPSLTAVPTASPSCPGAPGVTFSASPASITAGNLTILNWSVTNATSVFIDNGVGAVQAYGSLPVRPGDTATYTLSATGCGGTITRQAQVLVAPACPGPPVISNFSVSSPQLAAGNSTNLTWSVSNATSVIIDNGIGSVGVSGVRIITPGKTTVYNLTATGCGGNTASQVKVSVAPDISNFSASPTTIMAGNSTTLSWSVTNATSVSIDNGVGSVGTSGSVSVSPGSTTTYNLTATGPGGTKQSQVTVSVGVKISNFSASPTTITAGNSTMLSWSVSNATSVSIDNGIGSVGSSGSLSVSPASATTYTLTANGAGGSKQSQVTVTVGPKISSFSASPTTITAGSSTTLSWSVLNATSISIDNGVGSVGTSGSISVSPGSTTTYILTANGSNGSIQSQVTVCVGVKISSFSASPTTITSGNSTTLSWSMSNATTASIDNGVGSVGSSGSLSVSPGSTTTYILTGSGCGGSKQSQVTVCVGAKISSFSASPATITAGNSTVLTWSVSNASSVWIDNGIGSVGTSGSITVSPGSTTTYTLTVNGCGGTSAKVVTVTVNAKK